MPLVLVSMGMTSKAKQGKKRKTCFFQRFLKDLVNSEVFSYYFTYIYKQVGPH